MSIRLMSIAWKAPGLNPGQKLALVALCDNASDEGICFPAVRTLARKCSMGERTIQGHLSDFEARGFISREERSGRSTVYTIHPRNFCGPPDDAVGAGSAPPPAGSAPTPIYEEPSLNHQEPSSVLKPPKKTREKRPTVSLKTWLETTKAKGEDAIPQTHTAFTYAAKIGLPDDYLALAWSEFKHRYQKPGARMYADWRKVFGKAVEENWLKLWWYDQKTGFALTTAGEQAKLLHRETATEGDE